MPKYIYVCVLIAIILFGGIELYQYQKALKEVEQRFDLSVASELKKAQQELKEDIENATLSLEVGLKDIYALYSFPSILFSISKSCRQRLPVKTIFFIDATGKIILPAKKDTEVAYLPIQAFSLSQFAHTQEFLAYLKRAQDTKKSAFYLMYLPFFHKNQEKWVKRPFLAIIVPVFSPYSSQYLGAGVGILDLEAILHERLTSFPISHLEAVPCILDENNRIIYCARNEFIYQKIDNVIKRFPPSYSQKAKAILHKIEETNSFQEGAEDCYWPDPFFKFHSVRIVYFPFYLSDNARWIFFCCYPKSLIQERVLSFFKTNFIVGFLIIFALGSVLGLTNRFYTKTFETISRHQQAIESLANPFVITDLNGGCIHYNPTFERLFGAIKKGDHLYSIMPGRNKMPEWHEKMLNAVRKGRHFEVLRYKLQTLNGNLLYARIIFSPIKDKNGNTTSVAIDFNNITQQVRLEKELKRYSQELERMVALRTRALLEREKQYREIFENKLMGIFLIRPDGQFLLYNKTFKEMTGYNEEELEKIINFKEMCSPSEKPVLEKLFKDCLQKGNVFYREIEFFPKGKAPIFVELFLQVTQYKGKEALLGFIYDVTLRKTLEKKLREQDKIAVLGEMAAGVAHDINNLLMAVVGNLELAQYSLQRNPEKVRLRLQKAIEAIQEGEAIVRRLYAYAHRRMETAEVISDINQVLQETVRLTQPLWKAEAEREGKQIVVKEEYGKTGPIMGNVAELKEVFVNFIKNAIEAMPKGGEIIIKTWQEGNKNRIMIKDTGYGISEALKEKIFEPFFTTKGEKGTGLGLAVSLGIIRAHGGEIKVESQEGKGTTFYIYLPIIAPELILAHREKTSTPTLTRVKKKILLVDDEEEILEVLSELLSTLGIKVIRANLPSLALELFQQHQDEIGMVITDLGMPGISGFELAERFKKIKPSVPVVLLTGWGATITAKEMARYKIDEVLTKPATLDLLQQVLTKYDFC